jgi:integrase/recombinase XerD
MRRDNPVLFETAVASFLEMMRSERNASKSTIASYQSDLEDFYRFLGHAEFNRIEAQDLKNYQSYLQGTSKRHATIARRLSVLRQFYCFIQIKGLISPNPFACWERVSPISKRVPKHQHLLTQEEVTVFCHATHRLSPEEGGRLQCFLGLLYLTGLRVSDVVALPLTAVQECTKDTPSCTSSSSVSLSVGLNAERGSWRLHGSLLQIVQRYLSYRSCFETRPPQNKWLFPARSWTGHLTRQRVSQLLKEVIQIAGLDPVRFSLHTLRHTFIAYSKLATCNKQLDHQSYCDRFQFKDSLFSIPEFSIPEHLLLPK